MLDRTLMTLATALLAAPLADSPQNRYSADDLYTISYKESYELQLESITQSVNGVEVDLGEPTMTTAIERSLELTDEYAEVEDGVLLTRRRTFEELTGEASMDLDVMGDSESQSLVLSSPLEGETVLCEWKADEGRHSFRYDEGSDGPATLLEELLADAEFQMIPPEREVEEGDSWTVDLEGQRAFFAPGGLPHWEPELDGGDYNMLEPWQMVAVSLISMSEASQEIEGELKATWTETSESDGSRVATITLELEAELSADMGEQLSRMNAAAELSELDATYEVSWSVEGKGKVLWDLEAGHFLSLELACENDVEFMIGIEEDFGAIVVEAEVSGPSTIEASAE